MLLRVSYKLLLVVSYSLKGLNLVYIATEIAEGKI